MQKSIETSKIINLSTAHISEKTIEFLKSESKDSECPCIVVYKKDDFGFFVYITETKYLKNDVPEDLMECILFAKKHQCDMICFDSQMNITDKLKSYERKE